MGSGEQATLNLTGDNFLQVAVPTNTKTADGQALIDVSGKVRAAGGSVQLKAATVAQAIRNAVNVPGELSVTSARASGGSIILGGGPGGDVSVTGRLRASGRTAGGTIAITGHNLALRQAKLAARSAKGRGGSVTVTGTNAVSLASSLVDASGATGGGAIRIGGDFHGASDLTSAQTTTIDKASTLNASATVSGDGGTVAVWSDATTNFAGRITATGGPSGGDGGYVEVSANPATHGFLSYSGSCGSHRAEGKDRDAAARPFRYHDFVTGTISAVAFSPAGLTRRPRPRVINKPRSRTSSVDFQRRCFDGLAASAGTDEGNLTVSAPITWASLTGLRSRRPIASRSRLQSRLRARARLRSTHPHRARNWLREYLCSAIDNNRRHRHNGRSVRHRAWRECHDHWRRQSRSTIRCSFRRTWLSLPALGPLDLAATVDYAAPGLSGPCAAGCDLTVSGGGVTFAGDIGSLNPLSALSRDRTDNPHRQCRRQPATSNSTARLRLRPMSRSIRGHPPPSSAARSMAALV